MTNKYKEPALVAAQERIATDIYSLWLKNTNVAAAAKAGQFISLFTKDGGKLLPRPISICEIDAIKGNLRLVYRVTGKNTGTEQFSRLRAGDTIEIMGPLGNGFHTEGVKSALLIGGGIGVPPMVELAKQLSGEKRIVSGYRDELFLTQELEAGGTLYIATEDGSSGTPGNVLDAIKAYDLKADVIFACGPTPMLRAVKAYAETKAIKCYLSLEERMACGIGACLGCVCCSKEIDQHSHVKNKRICIDGPVFLASEVEL